MASKRLAGLVIGAIMVSLVLKYSVACAHQAATRKGKWLSGIASQNLDEDDDFSGASHAIDNAGRKRLIKGRKMGTLDGFWKKHGARKRSLDEKPKVSGKYPSEAQVSPADQGTRFDREETSSNSVVDDADAYEVGNKVMHSDYPGEVAARRKPPVNNQEPTD